MMHPIPLHRDASRRPIIVVEDSDSDLDLCLQAFEANGITNPVVVLRDGEDAIRYIDTHGDARDPRFPIFVLCDLKMPKVSGFDVLRHARRHPAWSLVPIIVLSTSRDELDVESAYRLGANSFVQKPIEFDAFSETISLIDRYWLRTNIPFLSQSQGPA